MGDLSWSAVEQGLAKPIPYQVLPQSVYERKSDRGGASYVAQATLYLDRTDVQRRLDEVVGAGNWSTTYTVLEGASPIVECTLSLRLSSEGPWVSKSDVGGGSHGDNPVNKFKSAYSDSFKRAADCWGIGRFLREADVVWLPCEVVTHDGIPVKKDGKLKFRRWVAPDPVVAVEAKLRLLAATGGADDDQAGAVESSAPQPSPEYPAPLVDPAGNAPVGDAEIAELTKATKAAGLKNPEVIAHSRAAFGRQPRELLRFELTQLLADVMNNRVKPASAA